MIHAVKSAGYIRVAAEGCLPLCRQGTGMHIFYHSVEKSTAADRYRRKLRTIAGLDGLISLPEGVQFFNTSSALKLRSGDIVILYAADAAALSEVVRCWQDFRDYRFIVVLGEWNHHNVRRAHLLHPCYIVGNDNTIEEVESVLHKISGPGGRHASG